MRNRGWQRITAGKRRVDGHAARSKPWAQMSTQDAPIDSIPELVELPNPRNNGDDVRIVGSGDEDRPRRTTLAPERVRSNVSLIRLGKMYDLAYILEPGQMGSVSMPRFQKQLG